MVAEAGVEVVVLVIDDRAQGQEATTEEGNPEDLLVTEGLRLNPAPKAKREDKVADPDLNLSINYETR